MAKKKASKKKVTKKQATKKATTKKVAAKKTAAKKTAAKKVAAKKTAAKKTAAKKSAAKAPASKPAAKSGGRLRVTLVRSTSSTPQRHRLWVRGLGLKRMHQTVEVEDTPANRGMINRAAYMLRVEEVA